MRRSASPASSDSARRRYGRSRLLRVGGFGFPPPLLEGSESFAFQPIPSHQAAYGFVDVRAGLFDVLHIEPP